eukprot:595124-Pelagomonas_calceolata.AAC.2
MDDQNESMQVIDDFKYRSWATNVSLSKWEGTIKSCMVYMLGGRSEHAIGCHKPSLTHSAAGLAKGGKSTQLQAHTQSNGNLTKAAGCPSLICISLKDLRNNEPHGVLSHSTFRAHSLQLLFAYSKSLCVSSQECGKEQLPLKFAAHLPNQLSTQEEMEPDRGIESISLPGSDVDPE